MNVVGVTKNNVDKIIKHINQIIWNASVLKAS